ncbi:hypothetical protein AAG906_037938 [Vitis piasezkii]
MARKNRWFNGRLPPTHPRGGGDNNGDFGLGFKKNFQSHTRNLISLIYWRRKDCKDFEKNTGGIIVERSRGFTLWIRFGNISLCCLWEEVEACCRDIFLLCYVVDSEAKKYCLVFPKGKGILEGWNLLAEKLLLIFFRTESRVGAYEGNTKNSYLGDGESLPCRLKTCMLWEDGKNITKTLKDEVSKVISVIRDGLGKKQEVRDEEEVISRTSCNVEQVQSHERDFLGFQLGSSPPALNLTEFIDEALMKETSKYIISYSRALLSLGKPDFSSSTTLSGWDGVIVTTDGSCAELGHLRMILADGRETEVSGMLGMANGVVKKEITDVSEKVFKEVLEEGNEMGESCW